MSFLCKEAFLYLLENSNSTAIYEGVKALKMLHNALSRGGFTLKKDSFAQRNDIPYKRLLTILQKQSELQETFSMFLLATNYWEKPCYAVNLLDEEWLLKNWADFLRSQNDPRLWIFAIYSAKLDNEKFTRRANLLFKSEQFWQEGWKNLRKASIPDCFCLFSTNVVTEKVAAEPDKKTLQQVKQLQEENSKLRDNLAKNRHELKHLHAEKDELYNALKKDYLALRKEHKEFQETYADKIKEISAEAQDFIQEEIDNHKLINLGLNSADELELQNLVTENVSIENRLDTALAKQAEINLRYGYRQELRNEISRLEGLLSKIEEALNDSIRVIDELPELKNEIEIQLAKKQQRLEDTKCSSDPVSAFVGLSSRVKNIKLEDPEIEKKLAEIKNFLQNQVANDFFTSLEKKAILEELESRTKLFNQNKETIARQSLKVIFNLENFQSQFSKTIIYIDGCNVLLRDKRWAAIVNAGRQASAREELVQKCLAKAERFNEINLVFDGNNPITSSEKVAEKLFVHFAAKKDSEQNADNLIVEQLAEKAAKDKESRFWLISDDLELRVRVREYCSAVITTTAFVEWLTAKG